jgi:DNA-binding response OmpR family regulator
MTLAHSPCSSVTAPRSFAGRLPYFKPPRILLADDDLVLRLLVAAALREDGYEVLESQDGGRLLVQIAGAYAGRGRETICDMIVSDIRMPVCSGVQILEGLRKAHWTTPVILITGFGTEVMRKKVESLRAIMLDKPFDLDDLRTVVASLLPGEGSDGAGSAGL